MRSEKEQSKKFQLIILEHKGILFKVALTYCRNNDIQDLIHEMMMQIWISLNKYNNKFSITTWLYRISLSVVISYYRKMQIGKF